jgi:hypothetical protein
MKKKFFFSVCLMALYAISFANKPVNEKVLHLFQESFPKAEQVSWQESGDTYIVNFILGQVRSRVNYDKEGNFISSIRYFSEEGLPNNILCKIKKRYPGEKIYGVTEMESDAGIEYFVKLESTTHWTTVKSDANGYLDQVEKLKKAY